MSSISKFGSLTMPAAAVAATLLLAGCGSSSTPANQTAASHTHTASVASASSTSSAAESSATSSSAQQTTTQTTSAQSSVSEARIAKIREHALRSYARCLRDHYINPKTGTVPPAERATAKKCLDEVEAAFKAETGK